jgi:hypothetical protein
MFSCVSMVSSCAPEKIWTQKLPPSSPPSSSHTHAHDAMLTCVKFTRMPVLLEMRDRNCTPEASNTRATSSVSDLISVPFPADVTSCNTVTAEYAANGNYKQHEASKYMSREARNRLMTTNLCVVALVRCCAVCAVHYTSPRTCSVHYL